MEVQVNIWAVALATLSSMVVGSIWYARGVFGNLWIKLAKIDMTKQGDPVWVPMLITVFVSFLTAYVLAHMVFLAHNFFNNSWLQDSLSTGFWVWLGFIATRLITHDAFEGRRKKLTLLNISHEFVTIMIMALMIGLIK